MSSLNVVAGIRSREELGPFSQSFSSKDTFAKKCSENLVTVYSQVSYPPPAEGQHLLPPVQDCQFNDDGTILVCANKDNSLVATRVKGVSDLSDGNCITQFVCTDNRRPLNCISTISNNLILTGRNQCVTQHDINTSTSICNFHTQGYVNNISLQHNSKAEIMALGRKDGIVQICDIRLKQSMVTGQLICQLNQPIYSAMFSILEQDCLAVACTKGAYIYDIRFPKRSLDHIKSEFGTVHAEFHQKSRLLCIERKTYPVFYNLMERDDVDGSPLEVRFRLEGLRSQKFFSHPHTACFTDDGASNDVLICGGSGPKDDGNIYFWRIPIAIDKKSAECHIIEPLSIRKEFEDRVRIVRMNGCFPVIAAASSKIKIVSSS